MKFLIMQPWISYRGAETMSVGLARELNKNGNSASMLGLFVDRQSGHGVNFILPPKDFQKAFKNNSIALYALGTFNLIYLILTNVKKFDVLVPYNLPTSWLAVIFGKMFGKPVVWMSQGIPEKDVNIDNNSYTEYLLWSIATSKLDVFLTRKIDKIVTPSSFTARKILDRYGKKAIVIPNPIAKVSGQNKDLPEKVLNLRKNNKFVFLQVGALHTQKRQIETIEIFKKILAKEPNCALIFVGEGHQKKEMEKKISQLGIEAKVYLAGYVPRGEIGAYYRICDLNLLPSISETFGATPLEALYYGKNSLVTYDSGIKEVISDFAIISKPGKESIYKDILKYINNKKYYDNLALKSKNVLKRLPSWKEYAAKLLKEIDTDPIETYKVSYYKSHYHSAPQDLLNERVVRMNRVIKYLKPVKNEKILDLGVGEGDLALELAKLGSKVTGIDYSSDAVALAKKTCGKSVKILKMDASKLSFPDNYFDKVISIDVFEHICQEKLSSVLKEIRRVIKPNGILVAETSPNTYFWYPIMNIGKILFNMKSLESEKYHINLFNYFRLKNTLQTVSDDVFITLHNDGKNFLSSRVLGSDLSGKKADRSIIYNILKVFDFLNENKVTSFVVHNSFLNTFLGHDLWAVVKFKK